MLAERLRKCRDSIRKIGAEKIEIVRANAEQLPYREEVFDLVPSLYVLEHLRKRREAVTEINRVVQHGSAVAISLPLENLMQKLLRIGFPLKRIAGDPILKRAKRVPIIRTPEYHYAGNAKSYKEMLRVLKTHFYLMPGKYTPIGFHSSLNVNAVHILQKKS